MSFNDGLARQIQTRMLADASDIVIQTKYNRVNLPERLLGPAYLPPSHTCGALTDAGAAGRVTLTTYDDDPLLKISRVISRGQVDATAVSTTYGF